MNVIDEVPVGPDARVYAEGWQSWSPTAWYGRHDAQPRPQEDWQHLMRFRPDATPPGWHSPESGDEPPDVVRGEGLLIVDPGDGSPVRTYGTLDATSAVPSIEASWRDGLVVVTTSDVGSGAGGVERWSTDAADGAGSSPEGAGRAALAAFGDLLGAAAGARTAESVPRVWCTWYQYFEAVTAEDVLENLAEIERLELPVDVVQIDDGWSLGTGEWTEPNPRFGALGDTVAAIRDSGRRAGIWLAPFTVGASSDLARRHPDWLVGPAGHNWGDDLMGLDLTHPGVLDYLAEVIGGLRGLGIEYAKLDFLYSGALPGTRHDPRVSGVEAYRAGVSLIREAFGDDVYLVGCGAPILPSVGLFDAMRISSDTFHEGGEDGGQGLRGRISLEARSWQHGRLWTTDPDCLVARPQFALRDEWADVVLAAPGLRGFSDRVADLDERGLDYVRRLLRWAS